MPIITHSTQTYNPSKTNSLKRSIYILTSGSKRVLKTSYKTRTLRLAKKKVANGPLFNNASLHTDYDSSGTTHITTVGVLYRGAERRHTITTRWFMDPRGNKRRYITQKTFKALPQYMQQIAIDKGVNVSGDVTFSRCVMAWAGFMVKGLDVHHVNMDTTDDRLGNLQALTKAEHAAAHSNKDDLLWDADWYTYTSCSAGILRVQIVACTTADDIAAPIADVPDDSCEEAALLCDGASYQRQYPAADQYLVDHPDYDLYN